MESLDILNYFLHDKVAAKMWKRTTHYSEDDLISFIYTSVMDDTRSFRMVWGQIHDDVWISDYIHGVGKTITVFSEDISDIHSTEYSVIFSIGLYSSMSILYGNRS